MRRLQSKAGQGGRVRRTGVYGADEAGLSRHDTHAELLKLRLCLPGIKIRNNTSL